MWVQSTHPERKPHVVHVGPGDDVQGDVVHVVDRAVDEGGADAVGAAAAANDFLVVVGVVGASLTTTRRSA